MEQFQPSLTKTFNTAKRYAEEILFPKMELFQKFQRQAEFGAENLNDSLLLSKEMRDIQRFNGIKAMNDILYGLFMNIQSTIMVNNKKGEKAEINRLIDICKKMKYVFNEHKQSFFISSYDGLEKTEILNREFFEKVKETIERMYINCEILMTKNKLLFAETRDEYLDDKTILQNIKDEYIGN
jgi:hypothetical protein